MLACPGFPADEVEEEEEVVHLLLYIPYLITVVVYLVCIRFKVYRYRTKPKPSLKAPKPPPPVLLLSYAVLHSTPVYNLPLKNHLESHIYLTGR